MVCIPLGILKGYQNVHLNGNVYLFSHLFIFNDYVYLILNYFIDLISVGGISNVNSFSAIFCSVNTFSSLMRNTCKNYEGNVVGD